MVTDPARIRKDDPGHQRFALYMLFIRYSQDKVDDICAQCRRAKSDV